MLGGKVEFLRGLSFDSGTSTPVAFSEVGAPVAVVAVVVVVVEVGALVVVEVGGLVVVVVEVGGLVVVAVLVVVLFGGFVEVIEVVVEIGVIELVAGIAVSVLVKGLDSRSKVVALNKVLENGSTDGVKASDGAAVISRSLCFSVGDVGINVGSMTGRIVVVKSMC